MRVELLVVADCPQEALAYARLRHALDETGHLDTSVETITVTTDTARDLPAFAGSPTIVIDGADLFSELASPGLELRCRLYPSATGLSGVPTLTALRSALSGR